MTDKFAGGIKRDSPDVSIIVLLRSTTDNTEVTGKTYSDVTLSYMKQGGTRQGITAATLGSVDAAHADGGFIEIDATNMPGLYRLDLPDVAVSNAGNPDWVVISVKCSGCYTFYERYALETENSAGLSTDIATVDSNVDAILVDTGTTLPGTLTTIEGKVDTVDTNVDAILVDTGTSGVIVATNNDKTGYSLAADQSGVTVGTVNALGTQAKLDVNAEADTALTDYDAPTKAEMDAGFAALNDPTAASVADAVWDEAIADHTTGTTFGGKNQKVVPSETINDYKADVSGVATASALATVDSNVDAILVDTGTTLPGTLTTIEGKIDTVDTVVDSILDDTGTSGVALTSAAVDAILDEVVEGTLTMRQMLRIMLSALAGKSSGGGTATITFRDVADGKARITATVDSNGNRTAITTDGT